MNLYQNNIIAPYGYNITRTFVKHSGDDQLPAGLERYRNGQQSDFAFVALETQRCKIEFVTNADESAECLFSNLCKNHCTERGENGYCSAGVCGHMRGKAYQQFSECVDAMQIDAEADTEGRNHSVCWNISIFVDGEEGTLEDWLGTSQISSGWEDSAGHQIYYASASKVSEVGAQVLDIIEEILALPEGCALGFSNPFL